MSDIVDAAYYDETKKKDVDRGIVFKRKSKIKKSKKYKSDEAFYFYVCKLKLYCTGKESVVK